ncbi:unnamed protein product [Phytophthora fragariaefolia]|uniref:Unnamed protein product n=1 Tax=Phytophthora fragariaefolia TaxID=1490495 RepID=A0A9W6WTA7_9STRA|nr:unnamed protein product [Phytophthora fragariaefolia]
MAKKKKAERSDEEASAARLFAALQEKETNWYTREREGIALIEGFQSALLAVRDAQAAAGDSQGEEGAVLAGLAGNAQMDPWLAEDLYQQVQDLSGGFEELLEQMYALHAQAKEIGALAVGAGRAAWGGELTLVSVVAVWLVLTAAGDEGQQVQATELRPVDYLQMMSQELATFEAEYQHIVRCKVGRWCLCDWIADGRWTLLTVGSAAEAHFIRDLHGQAAHAGHILEYVAISGSSSVSQLPPGTPSRLHNESDNYTPSHFFFSLPV